MLHPEKLCHIASKCYSQQLFWLSIISRIASPKLGRNEPPSGNQAFRTDMTDDTFRTPVTDFPGYRLRVASQAAISKLSESLGKIGLRIAEASVMVAIQANPGCRQSQIGKALHIASANLTPLLHQLERRGLITRTPLDGRTNALTLTEAGDQVACECLTTMKNHEKVLAELLAPIGVEDFKQAMTRINDTLHN
ncbi:MAG TPA: hypothetical protein DDZ43_07705 [Hyphomonadaceae bacterium]|nr:hypothetical protein [Ponticaulis sp.]RPG17750.1 MAG: MarR family transcriptional regulator [Hyphomonadaceae bacterium TMED125]HBH90312.1 hypothetical protein [Hyphomonadaceae bacterium]HBJ92747.1 hypothetical protein [Hyphomonadaceae bacterium]